MTHPRFLKGDGEMAKAMREHAWEATPLGRPGDWPRALKTLVGLMLTAKQAMFMAWGPDQIMLYNDAYAEMIGGKHPCLGKTFEDVWREIWPDIKPLVDQVFAGEPVHMDDITLFIDRRRGQGLEEAHYAFSYTPVFDDNGEVVGLFCPTRETTAQIIAEREVAAAREQAEQANVAKSTFIANMSHELRTPLSAIIGYSEMMLEEAADGAEAAELSNDIRKIEGNARHLLGLINDVLDLSKIESGRMEVYAETFEIEPVLREAAATAEALVGKKQNRLELEIGADLGSAHTDITKLRQILLNLLSNAAKFTEGGTILLRARREANDIALAVTDSGIGMTPDQLAQLFQRFTQADASTTRRFGGTGLGLSITRAFATMLGGTIEVVSEPGRGSTFTVRIPARLPAETGAAGHAEDAEEPPSDRTVLVIDDDASQRELMVRFLEREGFVARTASDGAAGLELARRLKPRAILLDVVMPGLDGWSVLSELKSDPVLSTIPVVMVTFVSERSLASSLGAVDYVAKPVQWDRFREVMDRFRDAVGDVLVVDDDADARKRLRRTLERDGWTVSEAEHGREALDLIARAMPRVVLLDLNMPVMDGFDFLHSLRDTPGCRDLPVIVLSARDLSKADRDQLQSAAKVITKSETSLREVTNDILAATAPGQ